MCGLVCFDHSTLTFREIVSTISKALLSLRGSDLYIELPLKQQGPHQFSGANSLVLTGLWQFFFMLYSVSSFEHFEWNCSYMFCIIIFLSLWLHCMLSYVVNCLDFFYKFDLQRLNIDFRVGILFLFFDFACLLILFWDFRMLVLLNFQLSLDIGSKKKNVFKWQLVRRVKISLKAAEVTYCVYRVIEYIFFCYYFSLIYRSAFAHMVKFCCYMVQQIFFLWGM